MDDRLLCDLKHCVSKVVADNHVMSLLQTIREKATQLKVCVVFKPRTVSNASAKLVRASMSFILYSEELFTYCLSSV